MVRKDVLEYGMMFQSMDRLTEVQIDVSVLGKFHQSTDGFTAVFIYELFNDRCARE